MASNAQASAEMVWAVREALSKHQLDAMQILAKF